MSITHEQVTELLRSKGMCGHVMLVDEGDIVHHKACILAPGHDDGIHDTDDEKVVRAAWVLFADFPRWKKAQVTHHPDCTGQDDGPWDVGASKSLTGDQWLRLAKMEEAARAARTTLPNTYAVLVRPARDHVSKCTECGGEAKAVSVQVTISDRGRYMVREFAL